MTVGVWSSTAGRLTQTSSSPHPDHRLSVRPRSGSRRPDRRRGTHEMHLPLPPALVPSGPTPSCPTVPSFPLHLFPPSPPLAPSHASPLVPPNLPLPPRKVHVVSTSPRLVFIRAVPVECVGFRIAPFVGGRVTPSRRAWIQGRWDDSFPIGCGVDADAPGGEECNSPREE
jgi:hypothetical protein